MIETVLNLLGEKQVSLKRSLVAAVVVLGLGHLSACGDRDTPRHDPPPPPAAGKLELIGLRSLVGRYPDDVGLWTSEPLRTRLQALLEERFPVFLSTMTEALPIENDGGRVMVRGVLGGRDQSARGLTVIDPQSGRIYVWWRVDGQVTEAGDASLTPGAVIRAWMDAGAAATH